jgi:hypothetical protein
MLDDDRIVRWLPSLVLLLLGLFLYLLRPRLFPGQEARNLVLVGSLISPLGLVLAWVYFVRRRWSEWSASQWLLFASGLVTCAVLITHRMIHPLLMWGIRRYVPLVLPFFLLLVAPVLADGLSARSRLLRRMALTAMIFIAGYLYWRSWPAVRIRENAGQPDFVAAVASHIETPDVVLCDHWKYATPLRYAFGLPAYQLSRQDKAEGLPEAIRVGRWMADCVRAGKTVYYVSVSLPFFHPGFRLEEVGYEETTTSLLVRKRSTLPREVQEQEERAYVYRLVPDDGVTPYPAVRMKLDIGYHAMGLRSGFYGMSRKRDIAYRWTDGVAEVYVPAFGPTAATRYRIRVAAGRSRPGPARIPVDVYADTHHMGRLDVGRDWEEHVVDLPPAAASRPTVCLKLVSPVWNPAEQGIRGYPEKLGIRLDWIEIEQVD